MTTPLQVFLILMSAFFVPVFAQKMEVDDKAELTKWIQQADGKFHKLEFIDDGVYLDGVLKSKLSERFTSITYISETAEYWEYDNPGYWFLFGTSMATGMCGIPNYGIVHIDSHGNLRVSKESPPACIGDFPIKVEFKLVIKASQNNFSPVWNISNSLEFNGTTFSWKDLQKPVKSKRK